MKFHVGQNWQAGSLEIYALSDDGTQQLRLKAVDDGTITVEQEELPEGVAASPFMRLSGVYAVEFEEGFKRYLGQKEHIVPKEVYEREAGRVDSLLNTVQTALLASSVSLPDRVVEARHSTFPPT